jgi:hypothetical protein
MLVSLKPVYGKGDSNSTTEEDYPIAGKNGKKITGAQQEQIRDPSEQIHDCVEYKPIIKINLWRIPLSFTRRRRGWLAFPF